MTLRKEGDKAPRRHAHRRSFAPTPDLPAILADGPWAGRHGDAGPSARERSQALRKPRNGKPFRRPPIPAWARASGRAGQGDPLFAAGAALALFDAFLRRDPPSAGALRSRLTLQSAAASAKILRLNADEGALRDLRFAVGDALGPAANLLRGCGATSPAARPASTPAGSPTPRRGWIWQSRTRTASRPA